MSLMNKSFMGETPETPIEDNTWSDPYFLGVPFKHNKYKDIIKFLSKDDTPIQFTYSHKKRVIDVIQFGTCFYEEIKIGKKDRKDFIHESIYTIENGVKRYIEGSPMIDEDNETPETLCAQRKIYVYKTSPSLKKINDALWKIEIERIALENDKRALNFMGWDVSCK
jgi:hypothetical protein